MPAVTHRDVARRAGTATVERVLDGRGGVSPATVERVLAAARALGHPRRLPEVRRGATRIEVTLVRPDSTLFGRPSRAVERIAATLDRTISAHRAFLPEADPAAIARRIAAPPSRRAGMIRAFGTGHADLDGLRGPDPDGLRQGLGALHLLHFSSSLIHLVVPSNPLLVVCQLHTSGFGAVVGHIGFDRIELAEERAVDPTPTPTTSTIGRRGRRHPARVRRPRTLAPCPTARPTWARSRPSRGPWAPSRPASSCASRARPTALWSASTPPRTRSRPCRRAGGLDAALALARGEEVDSPVDVPLELVTPDNMADYLEMN